MKIIVLIGHPAHVHMFKNTAREMLLRGHKMLFITLDKEFEIDLLTKEGFDYIVLGKKHKGILYKIWDTFRWIIKTYKIAKKIQPDMFLSHGSLIAAITSKLLKCPHISFEDTYNMEQVSIYAPFTDVIITSDYSHPLTNYKKNISIPIYNELLYLHPNRLSLPLPNVLSDDRYVLVRFVAWQASHDIGHNGITYDDKLKLVEMFSRYAKVYISSESELPFELEKYRLKFPPEKIHSILSNACLIFSEGSTMVEEAAMLGIPAIYINNNKVLYIDQLEHQYELCYTYAENKVTEAIERAISILQADPEDIQTSWQSKKIRMLNDHIDATAFLIWFVESYPISLQVIRDNKNNSDFWKQFK